MIDTYTINTHLAFIAHRIEFLTNISVDPKIKDLYRDNYLDSVRIHLDFLKNEIKKIETNQAINAS